MQVDAKALGPKLGPKMKDVLAATRSGDWQVAGGRTRIGGCELEAGQFVLQLVPKEGIVAAALSTNDAVLMLDVRVTPEPEQEGARRDFVRLVQQARKDAGLHVSDRIVVSIEADGVTAAALHAHESYVKEQVLAVQFGYGPAAATAFTAEGKVGSGAGAAVRFAIAKAR